MQRDTNAAVKFLIDKGIVGLSTVAIPIHEGVVPHIHIAEPSGCSDWTRRGIKVNAFPTQIEKPVVIWITRITTYKVGLRAFPIKAYDIR